MSNVLKKLNAVLLIAVLLQALGLFSTAPAKAQTGDGTDEYMGSQLVATSAFLYRPYYGAARNVNFWLDHQYPTYSNPPNSSFPGMLDYQGQTWRAYNGHSGYDFAMSYQPVLAAEGGKIEWAGWALANHDLDYGLYTRINHNNNHQTIYGHLSAIRWQTGENVAATWQIGTSGTTGNSTGPHLHFEMRYGANLQVKDPYGWTGSGADPMASNYPTSGTPTWYAVQNEWLWRTNREVATPPNNGEFVIDNGGGGFTSGCAAAPCQYWTTQYIGYNGSSLWTYSNGRTRDYWARWTPNFPSNGQYELLVYVPSQGSSADASRSHAARYRVVHTNGGAQVERTIVVDQHRVSHSSAGYSSGGQWISLGRYSFNAGTGGYVEVTDAAFIDCPGVTGAPASVCNYTESASLNRKLIVDAVMFRRTN